MHDFSDPPGGLNGSKSESLRSSRGVTSHLSNDYNLRTCNLTVNENEMDLGIVAALIMIAVWAVVTFTTEAPGYVHLLLTIGFFLLFWRVMVRSRSGGRKST
jgi:hypothetical protein